MVGAVGVYAGIIDMKLLTSAGIECPALSSPQLAYDITSGQDMRARVSPSLKMKDLT